MTTPTTEPPTPGVTDGKPCPRCHLRGPHECLPPIDDFAVRRTGEGGDARGWAK